MEHGSRWEHPGVWIHVSHLLFADGLIPFAEVKAGDDQVACIKEGLESFCRASGQRINFAKSLVSFSPNISEQEMASLSAYMRILHTIKLGRYLGYHLVQQGSANNTHDKAPAESQVQAGWLEIKVPVKG